MELIAMQLPRGGASGEQPSGVVPVASGDFFRVDCVWCAPGVPLPVTSETAHVYIIEGDLCDATATYGPRSLLTYEAGSTPGDLRSGRGATLIAISHPRPEGERRTAVATGATCAPRETLPALDALRPSRTYPGMLWSALLSEAGNYRIELVRWSSGMVYPDHRHRDTETIHLLEGDLADHGRPVSGLTRLTYPPGRAHRQLRTAGGAEFLLVWTGARRMEAI